MSPCVYTLCVCVHAYVYVHVYAFDVQVLPPMSALHLALRANHVPVSFTITFTEQPHTSERHRKPLPTSAQFYFLHE